MNTLTIYISRDEVPHLTKTRPFIHVRKCRVKKEDEEIYLRELLPPPAEHRYNQVKLVLRGRFITKRLRIPTNVEHAILWHINNFPRRVTAINDERFAYRVANIQSVDSWKLKRTRRLRVGDNVFFMKNEEVMQKAVFIGVDLCLLIWEDGGPLEVTGIRDIKQALGVTHIATWHPD